MNPTRPEAGHGDDFLADAASKIGAGGMAEVYPAQATKLDL